MTRRGFRADGLPELLSVRRNLTVDDDRRGRRLVQRLCGTGFGDSNASTRSFGTERAERLRELASAVLEADDGALHFLRSSNDYPVDRTHFC